MSRDSISTCTMAFRLHTPSGNPTHSSSYKGPSFCVSTSQFLPWTKFWNPALRKECTQSHTYRCTTNKNNNSMKKFNHIINHSDLQTFWTNFHGWKNLNAHLEFRICEKRQAWKLPYHSINNTLKWKPYCLSTSLEYVYQIVKFIAYR